MAICKLDDVEIAYNDRGVGPALVLLHGFPLDSSVWDDAADFLEGKFRVITPDLRGFGRSADRKAFTIESLADDVHRFISAVDAVPCILGGLSMGGYVALAFAKKYPGDLKGLALIDTKAAADSPEAKEGRQKMIDLVRASGSSAIADQMFPKMIAQASAGAAAAKKLRSIMEACPALTIEHALAAMRDREDFTALLPKLEIPLLIVVGEQDAIASPEIARAMHKSAPRSRLLIIRGAGHMAPIEQPQAFADAIRMQLAS